MRLRIREYIKAMRALGPPPELGPVTPLQYGKVTIVIAELPTSEPGQTYWKIRMHEDERLLHCDFITDVRADVIVMAAAQLEKWLP